MSVDTCLSLPLSSRGDGMYSVCVYVTYNNPDEGGDESKDSHVVVLPFHQFGWWGVKKKKKQFHGVYMHPRRTPHSFLLLLSASFSTDAYLERRLIDSSFLPSSLPLCRFSSFFRPCVCVLYKAVDLWLRQAVLVT